MGLFRRQPALRTRRRAVPLWLRRILLGFAAAGVVAGYFAGVAHLTRSGWVGERLASIEAALAEEIADAGFRVRSIEAQGMAKTEAAVLWQTLGIQSGQPIFAIDLERARQQVERLPWIRVATVERSLPDTLIVRVLERQPLALWQRDGDISLIDETGTIVPDAPLEDFRDLPLLAGEGVPQAAGDLLSVLQEDPALARRVTGASHIEHRRWDVLVDDRVWVKLPQTGVREAWLRLGREEQLHGVLARNVISIDARNGEQWVFRLPPGERLRMALEKEGG